MEMPVKLEWVTPEGWQTQPAGGMRLANYLVPASDQTGQVSVVVLPQVVGRELEVLNIFRERLGVPPLEQAELADLGKGVPIGSEEGKLFDMLGEKPEDNSNPNRLLVAVFQNGPASYFFNFFGPSPLVESEKPKFLALLKSVTKPAGSTMDAAANVPMAPPMAAAPGSASGLPAWTVPEGWQELPPKQMLLARFGAKGEGGEAEITVSRFPGDVGGMVANINRWRGQLGLTPQTEDEVNAALTPLKVEGGSGMLVEMANGEAGNGKRLIGVIWPREGQTWFYKMVGDDSRVAREKESFIRFVQSVRHSDA